MTRHEKRVPTYQIYPSNVQLGVILSARVLLRILSVQRYPSVIPYSIPCQSTLLFECLTRSFTIITPQLTINIHITKITGPDSHIIYTPPISYIHLGNYRVRLSYHIYTSGITGPGPHIIYIHLGNYGAWLPYHICITWTTWASSIHKYNQILTLTHV